MDTIVSAALTALIVIMASIILFNAINAFTEDSRALQSYNSAKNTMTNLRSVIDELLFEATGSRRSINLDVNGRFIVAGDEDKIKYKVYDFALEKGLVKEEEGMKIIYGPVMSAYEKDIDNDGTADLVLENEFVLFAVKKINGALDTANMITMMRNKEMDIDIVPASAIMIDDLAGTSYGSGYTELTRSGYDIEASSIKIVMNSDAGISYNAIFSLGAGNDFIEMEVII